MAIFTNQATLSYQNTVTSSNVATGQLLEALSLTKRAVLGEYAAGETVTYVLSVVNSGTSALTGLTVTDNLGAYTQGTNTYYPLTYVDGSIQGYANGTALTTTPTVTAGPPMTITGFTVPASGNVTLIYQARVNAYAPLSSGSTIENTATVSGTDLPTAVSAEATVTASTDPELTISKSMNPTTVTENDTLTYTFVIQNSGSTEAVESDNVAVSDTFDPKLSNLSVTFNGTALTLNTDYTYDESTGAFATVAGKLTVPAATYTQDTTTGRYTVTPGFSTLVVSGTV